MATVNALDELGESGPAGDSKIRWIISSSALFLLEQIFKIDRFPSLEMRQRLADDLGVSARQVCGHGTNNAPARAPTRGPGFLVLLVWGSVFSRCAFTTPPNTHAAA